MSQSPLMILVAGPYRSGTIDDPTLIAANVAAMNQAALALFRAGHIPVLGEWFALPLIETAGGHHGDAIFTEIFHPVAHAIATRCDACLRIGGPSSGADGMVDLARSLGQQVFRSLDEVPAVRA
ncbi:NUDIX hydrolase [Kouleothrix aurantiaca]|uniref:NUDIX hydrolase n=1 Tax=Kouleothrix aurantiaca TaxID=186479 RepID=A0A0P9H5V6_9CHLR|nr:NUDIX hydrolase [Kouleothrix aurantiaca]